MTATLGPEQQPDLFASLEAGTEAPQGLRYQEGLLDPAAADLIVRQIETLPFRPFEFHGYVGKREVVSFGWRYEYGEAAARPASDIPSFLLPLRESASAFANLPAEALDQVLVTRYSPGAGIGWHRDKAVFGEVVGVSLQSACTLRFRRRRASGWARYGLPVQPASVYLLTGPARTEWEHSIAAVDATRYSITLRRYLAGAPSTSA